MARGRLIVLNGTSSSGKTSIARALQARWPTPLLYLALDTVIGMMPFQYTGNGTLAKDGYSLEETEEDGKRVVKYSVGPHGKFLNAELARLASTLCSAEYDVILDHVITDDETMIALAECTVGHSAYLIAVRCDGRVTEARERSRGDRLIGLAAGQTDSVHDGLRPYDLSVDSSQSAPDELAEAIIRHVEGALPTGLRQIASGRIRVS